MLQPSVNRFRLAREIIVLFAENPALFRRIRPRPRPHRPRHLPPAACERPALPGHRQDQLAVRQHRHQHLHARRGARRGGMFSMLPKKGTSNTRERIELVQRHIRLFGAESIDCLLADREFVGEHWVKWLNDNGIRYHIRIRDNFWVDNPRKGDRAKAHWMLRTEGRAGGVPSGNTLRQWAGLLPLRQQGQGTRRQA